MQQCIHFPQLMKHYIEVDIRDFCVRIMPWGGLGYMVLRKGSIRNSIQPVGILKVDLSKEK